MTTLEQNNKIETEEIIISDVRASFKDAANILNQALFLFTMRDVVTRYDSKERDEALELYRRVGTVSKWLKDNSL